jgi:hypothetical protein
MKRFAVRFGIALGAVLLVTFLTLLPMCNLMFSCGCTFLGAAHCNIHHATGPMCPWCAHRNAPFLIGYGVTLTGAAGSILAALKRRAWSGGLVLAVAAGVAGYVGTLSVCGLATALYFHYPTWYGLHLHRFYR